MAFFEDAAKAAQIGAALGGPIAFLVLLVARGLRPLDLEFLGKAALISTGFAFLGGVFGIALEVAAEIGQ